MRFHCNGNHLIGRGDPKSRWNEIRIRMGLCGDYCDGINFGCFSLLFKLRSKSHKTWILHLLGVSTVGLKITWCVAHIPHILHRIHFARELRFPPLNPFSLTAGFCISRLILFGSESIMMNSFLMVFQRTVYFNWFFKVVWHFETIIYHSSFSLMCYDERCVCRSNRHRLHTLSRSPIYPALFGSFISKLVEEMENWIKNALFLWR